MPSAICPYLMFDPNAEAAINFNVSLLPGGRMNEMTRYEANAPGPDGTGMKASSAVAADSPVKTCFLVYAGSCRCSSRANRRPKSIGSTEDSLKAGPF